MASANTTELYIPLSAIMGMKLPDNTLTSLKDAYILSAKDVKAINDNFYYITKKILGGINLSDITDATVDALTATTVITENLYATYGDIAELTVDRLETADKIDRYWNEDTSDVNYVSIQGQYIKLITGHTTGSTTQHTNRNGDLLYYNSAPTISTYKTVGMTTTATAYPVTVYSYTPATKMEMSFTLVGSTYEVDWILGAGSGTGNYGKTRIHKDTTGVDFSYFNSSNGTERKIRIDNDNLYASGNTGGGFNLRNIAIDTTSNISGYASQSGDLEIPTDDYSRYDRDNITSSTTVTSATSEFIELTGTTSSQTLTITSPGASAGVCEKYIKNSSTQTWTIGATVDGTANPTLESGASIHLLWNNTDWRKVGTYSYRFGDATNNTHIESDGTLVFSGTATVFEDLRVPTTSTKLGGIKDPGFSLFRNNGSSVGVFAYQFDATQEEELFFAVQIPHAWKIGSAITPHVHWGVNTVPAGGTTVRWGLEYTIADVNGVFSAPSIIYTTATDPVTQYKHILSAFSDITMTSYTGVSAMILCRVFRDVANDNFAADAALFEFDFHYEIDTVGSRTATSK